MVKSPDIPGFEHYKLQKIQQQISSINHYVRTHPKIKLGIIGHICSSGGAEIWGNMLVKYCDPKLIECSGFAFELQIDHEFSAQETRKYGTLDCGPEAILNLCYNSDVVIIWGIGHPERYLPPVSDPRRPAVILTSHGDNTTDYTRLVFIDWQLADGLVAVSRKALEPIDSVGALDHARIIYNCIDPSRLLITKSREQTRKEWGISSHEKVLGFMGRFCDQDKNPRPIIDCAKFLPVGWRVVMAGDGMNGDSIRAYAKKNAPGAILLGHRTDPGDVLRAFDCLALSSLIEGCALVVLESWYLNLPVLATSVGIIPEVPLVRLIEPTGESIADGLRQDLKDPTGVSRRVRQAKLITDGWFTPKIFGHLWTEYILEIHQKEQKQRENPQTPLYAYKKF